MAVETYSKSEEDVEQQMYKAMANKMQHDGTDVAAEAIAQTVKELFPLSPPEPTEEEEELAEKIAAYFMTVFQPSEDYVVRGALLRLPRRTYPRQNTVRCGHMCVPPAKRRAAIFSDIRSEKRRMRQPAGRRKNRRRWANRQLPRTSPR